MLRRIQRNRGKIKGTCLNHHLWHQCDALILRNHSHYRNVIIQSIFCLWTNLRFFENLLHIVIKGTSSGGVGELCNFLLGVFFVVPAGAIYQAMKPKDTAGMSRQDIKKQGLKAAIIGSLAGAVLMAVCSVPLNYFLTYPIYTKFMPMEAIIGMYQAILPSVKGLLQCLIIFNMPFTFVKGLLDVVICFLIYKPLSPILHGK